MGDISDQLQKTAPAKPVGFREIATKSLSYEVIKLRNDLEDAAKEVLLHKKGKIRLQTLDEFLYEL